MSIKNILDKFNVKVNRRTFLKGTAAAGVAAGLGLKPKKADAFAYEPYPTDDELTTVPTSCAHNCGSRHMLVAHKKGDVIVRLSTDDGRYQPGGFFGKDTFAEPQLRGCLRGRTYRLRLYSPERILYPMKRVGPRGSGQFKRISWEQALDEIAQKMVEIKQKYGPQALLDVSYAGASWGVLHKSDQIMGLQSRFLGLFGCRTSIWSVPSYEGVKFSSNITFGTIHDGNEDDIFAHCKLIIMWGWNPAYTFHGGNTFYYMRMAKQNGCKFVLVDPQYTDAAGVYDAWWIPIKPGTDAAMLAAMAYYIFKNNLQDQEFINKFTLGVDEGTMPAWAKAQGLENFKDYIMGKYDGVPKTPEWAEKICGVPAQTIKKLAHMYATTKPAALKASWAPARADYGEQYSRMAAALQAITGNIGVVGGSSEGIGKGWHPIAYAWWDDYWNIWFASIKTDKWPDVVLKYPNLKREDIGLWPRNDELDGVIPHIRGAFFHGANFLNQLPNVKKGIEAIKKLELVVVNEATMNPTALHADYILPAATHFERLDVSMPWYKGHYYIFRPRVIRPLGEAKTDLQIYTELAFRLGFGNLYNPRAPRNYFWDDDVAMEVDESYLRDWWENQVRPLQNVEISWEEFKKHGVYKFPNLGVEHKVAFYEQIHHGKPFPTPSGKIEIFSTTLAGHHLRNDWKRTQYGRPIPYIPKWIEPVDNLNNKELTKEYPFHCVSPHPRWRTHSIYYNIPWLRETYEQEVTINADDAKRLGIKEGDMVEVYSRYGSTVLPAHVTERVMPGVCVIHEGAWFHIAPDGTDLGGNPDVLTKDEPSPAGALVFNSILVNIRKTNKNHDHGWDVRFTSRSWRYRVDRGDYAY